MLRDSSHTVAVANISVGCAKIALLRTPGHLCSNLGTDLPPHTLKWVPIHGTSHGTPVPKKCRKGDQLREVTFVCLCVGVSVSSHTAVPMATELQSGISHAVYLLGRCVSDCHLTSMWLWAELVNVVNTLPTDIQSGLVKHRVKPAHWHWKQFGFVHPVSCMHGQLLISCWHFHYEFVHHLSC